MVSYALLFLAFLVGLTFARQGSSDRDEGHGIGIAGALFRMIADAIFWTFHPFSPLYIHRSRGDGWEEAPYARGARRAEDDVPFYEKVNRFVFGPARPK
jgi:hypothetical protein